MHKEGYYSTGQFSKLAGVTVRTIRFYDKQNVLKPSYVNESGARFYTDHDLARLQQILLLKYLGFSLEEIKQTAIDDSDYHYLLSSLRLQKKLVEDRIEQLGLVSQAIEETAQGIEKNGRLQWNQMLELIHLTGMEHSLAVQYKTASNLSARIRLHTLFSENTEGWFPWVYRQCDLQESMRVLEVGCGDGALWTENMGRVPAQADILVSDISEGMVRDARRSITAACRQYEDAPDNRFSYDVFDCGHIPAQGETFHRVIANHVLFYVEDVRSVCRECRRVLRPGGRLICSAYGREHMKEITLLVQEFDPRIVLSGERLYEKFGLEQGRAILEQVFGDVQMRMYPDRLLVTEAEPLIEYILSCHGNQNQYILDRFADFRQFVQTKVKRGFVITKEAGVFICG